MRIWPGTRQRVPQATQTCRSPREPGTGGGNGSDSAKAGVARRSKEEFMRLPKLVEGKF